VPMKNVLPILALDAIDGPRQQHQQVVHKEQQH